MGQKKIRKNMTKNSPNFVEDTNFLVQEVQQALSKIYKISAVYLETLVKLPKIKYK